MASLIQHLYSFRFGIFTFARGWLNNLEVHDYKLACWLCRLIPASCPFERVIKFWGGNVVHIPPLCHVNPLYEEVVNLRLRALCYLVDECGCDIAGFI
ncbi:Mo-dependent nitrogenase family protein [Calothrix sp. NIES-4071]|nr:Mo-dependent nitrogenase family protein [Calothrix sp. NIES-4071]BAZ57509.1 Mo-dependent nitrogenase family protein [Calothrix sp. NIES-4105]